MGRFFKDMGNLIIKRWEKLVNEFYKIISQSEYGTLRKQLKFQRYCFK
jgi:hypothetical protein